MKHPKVTIILRHYSLDEAKRLARILINYESNFAVEVTLNSYNALNIISELNKEFGEKLYIGAGTVRNMVDVVRAIDSGAKFLLGPIVFTKEMIDYAKKRNVKTIPGAFTPSEIYNQFALGADIVKVFPANSLPDHFFKDIQAPLGDLELMAVGGVGCSNYLDYLSKGCNYVGVGSTIFDGKKINELTDEEVVAQLEKYI